ncbi:MAG: LysR family transcriptional regulator [Burkholderiaceae bacterium]|nr:LysR family transcriptional regulator [Burkholderiaceae bacterium]
MSFTKAATKLHISQSTLTVQVRALEESYGVELFARTSRGLQLSKLGGALFEVTRQIFILEEQAVELLRASGDEVGGELRVGTVGPFFVMKLLAQYQVRYPAIQVSIDSDNSEGVVRKILDSVTDVAITGSRIDEPRLAYRQLAAHEILVLVNRRHEWARLKGITLAQFEGQRVIMREKGSMTRSAFERTLAARGIAIRQVMEVSRDAMREAVIEGLGVGLAADAEFQPHPDLRALRIRDHPSYTQSYVVCLTSRQYLKPIALFAELAESVARTAAARAIASSRGI